MGLSASSEKQVEENPNFNIESYNQKVASSGIYTQNPMAMHNEQEYYLKDNGHIPKPLKVEESTVSKVNVNFSIIKNSLSILKQNQRIIVNFKYIAKKEGQIKLLFMVDETENQDTGIPTLIPREEMVQNVKPTSDSGFLVSRQISPGVALNTLNLERKQNQKWSPFVIIIGDQSQKLYTFARTVNNFSDTVIIKQKLQSGGKAFFMQQVFGLAKSSDQRLCIICYSDPSEVIIFPCGHMCLCFACCGELMRTSENCPICRKPISSYEKIKNKDQEQKEAN